MGASFVRFNSSQPEQPKALGTKLLPLVLVGICEMARCSETEADFRALHADSSLLLVATSLACSLTSQISGLPLSTRPRSFANDR